MLHQNKSTLFNLSQSSVHQQSLLKSYEYIKNIFVYGSRAMDIINFMKIPLYFSADNATDYRIQYSKNYDLEVFVTANIDSVTHQKNNLRKYHFNHKIHTSVVNSKVYHRKEIYEDPPCSLELDTDAIIVIAANDIDESMRINDALNMQSSKYKHLMIYLPYCTASNNYEHNQLMMDIKGFVANISDKINQDLEICINHSIDNLTNEILNRMISVIENDREEKSMFERVVKKVY